MTRVATIWTRGEEPVSGPANRDISLVRLLCVWRTDRSWLPRESTREVLPTPTCARGSRAFARDERVGIFPSAGAHPFPRPPSPPSRGGHPFLHPAVVFASPLRFHPPAPLPSSRSRPRPRSHPDPSRSRASQGYGGGVPPVTPQPRRLRRPRRPVHPRVRAQRHAEPLGPDEPSRRRRRPRPGGFGGGGGFDSTGGVGGGFPSIPLSPKSLARVGLGAYGDKFLGSVSSNYAKYVSSSQIASTLTCPSPTS